MDCIVCRLVPAGDTEFAKDAAFGYKSSNLREVLILFILIHCYNLIFVALIPKILDLSGNFPHLNHSGLKRRLGAALQQVV